MPTIDPNNPLGLLFVASFVIQQILEAITWPVERWITHWWRRKGFEDDSWKKSVFGVIGFILGLFLAWMLNLHVLEYYIADSSPAASLRGGRLDMILTAIVLGAGTEGTNSVLKYLKYLKEDKKATAAETVKSLTESARRGGATVAVSASALSAMEMLKAKAGAPEPVSSSPSRSSDLSYIGNK